MKKCYILLVLFLALLSLPLFGDGLQSPEEMTTEEILTELIQLQKESLKDLESRTADLNQREINLNQREQALLERETELSQRETDLQERETFWQSYKKEMESQIKAEFWRGFTAGGLTLGVSGAIVGGGVGLRIGILID